MNDIYVVPITLIVFLEMAIDKNISELYSSIHESEHCRIDEYITWLIERNMIVVVDKSIKPQFAKLNSNYFTPYQFTNGIIDYDGTLDLEKCVNELLSVQCQNIEIRAYMSLDDCFVAITKVCELIESKNVKSIALVFGAGADMTFDNYADVFVKYKTVCSVLIYGFHSEETLYGEHIKYVFSTQHLLSNIHCGSIGIEYFAVNIVSYSESLEYNSCLNGKISIDCNGDVKSCPSMREVYGNIEVQRLADIIEFRSVDKLWNVSKDRIKVCRDCEFRYVCTDCRAYLEDPDDILSKPLKCGYDPYTGEWSEWSTNHLKQKAIDFYGMREFLDKI